MSSFFHVSARDHGAVILMSELARAYEDGAYRSLHDVAHDMGLSDGYLEEIASALKKADLIEGRQGPKGGYRLARAPHAISLEEVLTALEGPVELVDCQSKNVNCPVQGKCSSKRIWKTLQETVQKTLQETTLAETL